MTQLTIQQINSAIMFGNFSNDQLNSINDAVKYARAQLGKQVKRELVKGATVKFNSEKLGGVITGTVEKVKIKFVLVNTPRGRWNVPANMLEVV